LKNKLLVEKTCPEYPFGRKIRRESVEKEVRGDVRERSERLGTSLEA
jgi:hypothetical protein